MERSYDVIVIGAGAVGENAAAYAAQHGLDVVVVESELVGGECTYWACMPSKALLRPGEALAAARRVPAAAAAITGHVDVDKALRSRDAFTSHWDDEAQVRWLDAAGVDLVRGHGRVAGDRTVEVTNGDGEVVPLRAERGVVVATGSRSTMPPIDGLADVDPWDNRDVTAAKEIPDRLLVVGGGVVGVEMAQAAARLGASEVTIVEVADRLLGAEEPFVDDLLREVFEDEGIRVEVGATILAASREGSDGPVTLRLDDGRELSGDEVLVATGRRARTDDLGLDTVGVSTGKGGWIEVDDHLRVPGHDWLYAVGDVNGRALLTHQGKYQARLVGDALAGLDVDPAWADRRALPRVVFTDPHVAAVGLTEQQARDREHDVLVVSNPYGGTAGGALLGKDVPGTVQFVVDRVHRTLLGATFVGPGAGELLHAATIAIAANVTVEQLWHAVPVFPTVSEVWLRLLEELRTIEQEGFSGGKG